MGTTWAGNMGFTWDCPWVPCWPLVSCPCRSYAGFYWVLGGPELGNMHKTHIGPRFKFHVGTTWGQRGLEIRALRGIVHGFHVGPLSVAHVGHMQDFTGC